MSLQRVIHHLLALFLGTLPWQTRYIYAPAHLHGTYWEYGTRSLYGTEILGWIIILLYGAYAWQIRRGPCAAPGLNRKKFFLQLIFVIGGIIFFIAHSIAPAISLPWTVRALQAVALALIIREFISSRLLAAFWLGGLVQGALSTWQFFTQAIPANKWLGLASHSAADLGAAVIETADGRWLRAYGAFGWPNSLGIYLAVVAVAGVLLYGTYENKKTRALIAGGQLVIISGLLLSFSRGAWLAALMGTAVAVWGLYKNGNTLGDQARRHLGKGLAILVLASVIIVMGYVLALYPLFAARVAAEGRLEDRSLAERVSQWAEAKKIIKDNFFLGVGPGAYTAALAARHPGAPAWRLQPAHNIYILALAELGVVGIALAGYALYRLFFLVRAASIVSLGLIVPPALAGLFDHWPWSLYTGVLLWAVALAFIKKPAHRAQVQK